MSVQKREQNFRISDYKIGNLLAQGAFSSVYLAYRDGKTYAIKAFQRQPDVTTQSLLVCARREASLLARVEHPNLIRVEEVGEDNDCVYVVMDFFEGKELQEIILKQSQLSLKKTMSVMRQLATALHQVHSLGLIHRDVKPANILVDASGQLKLIDLGLAQEYTVSHDRFTVVGTLNYASPEQTGRLSRAVDARSDLYSAGIVFYQCLTGQLPASVAVGFDDSERLALAQKVSQVTGSPLCGEIIAKLLALDPDDRYQTCEGFIEDLKWLEEGRTHAPESFVGLDAASRLRRRPTGLFVGREKELIELTSYLCKSHPAGPNITVILGGAGLGKSRLVEEALYSLWAENTLTLKAKATLNSSAPFAVVRELLQQFFAEVKKFEPSRAELIRERIRENFKGSFAHLKDIHPELTEILDPTGERSDAAEEIDPAKHASLVASLLVNILRGFQTVYLWIDDLQWTDPASRRALEKFLNIDEPSNTQVLFTQRTSFLNDVEFSYEKNAPHQLTLESLGQHDVAAFAQKYLGLRHFEDEHIKKFYALCRGNSFAMREFLNSALETGALFPGPNAWCLDGEVFKELAFSTNSIDLMQKRIEKLSSRTQTILNLAALLGAEFSTDDLERLEPAGMVYKSLEEASAQQLVHRLENKNYRFVHDSVTEALLSRMPTREKEETHRRLAALALTSSTNMSTFQLAEHAVAGYANQALPAELYPKVLDAAQSAYDMCAYSKSFEWSQTVYKACEKHDFADADPLRVREIYIMSLSALGHFEQSAQLISEALRFIRKPSEKARLLYIAARDQLSQGQYRLATETSDQALRFIGTRLFKSIPLSILAALGYVATYIFLNVTKLRFGSSTGSNRTQRVLLSKLLLTTKYAAYLEGRFFVLPEMFARDLVSCHFLGECAEHARALLSPPIMLAQLKLVKLTHWHLRKGYAITDKMGDRFTTAFSHMVQGVSTIIYGAPVKGEEFFEKQLATILRDCPVNERSIVLITLLFTYYYRGDTKKFLAFSEAHSEDELFRKSHAIYANWLSAQQSFMMMLGRVNESKKFNELATLELARVPEARYAESFRYMSMLFDMYESGETDFVELQKIEDRLRACKIEDYFARTNYILLGYLWDTPETKKQFMRSYRGARLRSITNIHRCHVLVQKGMIQARKKNKRAPMTMLGGLAEAIEAKSYWGMYEAQLALARYHRDVGQMAQALYFAEQSHIITVEQQWHFRERKVRLEFNLQTKDRTSSNIGRSSSGSYRSDQHFNALMGVSRAIAQTFNFETQVQATLKEIISVMKAERAFIFLSDADGGSVRFAGGQNSDGQNLDDPKGYSSTVVLKVARSAKGEIILGNEQAEAVGSRSAVVHNLRSIAAVPMLAQNGLKGILYLDSRIAKGVFAEKDLELLTILATQIGIAFETSELARIESDRLTLQKDLELSAAVQRMFLPQQSNFEHESFSLAGDYKSASQCGGDWWWFDQSEPHLLDIYIADVTGHGAGSAMITASIAACYRSLKLSNETVEPDVFLGKAHALLKEVSDGRYLMTAAAARFDFKKKTVQMWGAGCPPIAYSLPDQESDMFLEASSPLGLSELNLTTGTVPLISGQRYYFFTDGLSEVRVKGGRQLGEKRLLKMFSLYDKQPLSAAVAEISKSIDSQRTTTEQEDDMTFVAVEIK